MAVPAHDTRDNEFALKYNIPIKWVVRNEASSSDEVYPGVGIIENSSSVETGLDINQLSSKEAALKVIEWAARTGNGKKKVSSSCLLSLCKTLALLFLTFKGFSYWQVNYKLRDWLFARQRYWGEPIPILILDESGETIAVSESELPLTLPELNDFTPTGTGEPPLSKAVSWVCFAFWIFKDGDGHFVYD